MSARERILARVREALDERPRVGHPGPFAGGRPGGPPPDPADAFAALFRRSGGEVVRADDLEAACRWLGDFAAGFPGLALGTTTPPSVHDAVVGVGFVPVERAPLGISMAVGAVAETGSLILDARDGRRVQILPPTHVVLVHAGTVHPTLAGALRSLRGRLPSALALHSGPSKSADIGQILVKGVHGPGRVVALVIGRAPEPDTRDPDPRGT